MSLVPTRRNAETGDLVCGKVEASCICTLPDDGHEIHVCGSQTVTGAPCGGSWHYEDDGLMMPNTWPNGTAITGNPILDFAMALFGGSDDDD